jgi:hypothetical protein
MPRKRSFAVVIVDTLQYELARRALLLSLRELPIGQILVYSDTSDAWSGLPVQRIPPIRSVGDYNRLITRRLAEDLRQDHVLVVQYDGFVLNPGEFSPHFYHYDYIGAPWAHLPGVPGGNGGFSWRSRRLVESVASMRYDGESEPEDLFICLRAAQDLIRQGLTFGPAPLASHFSVESVQVSHPTFGFHGVFHLPAVYGLCWSWLLENLEPHTLLKWATALRTAFAQLSPEALDAFDRRLTAFGAVQSAPASSPALATL